MRTFKLNKLVRDGIVEDHFKEGGSVDYFVLSKKDRLKALADKLVEESTEFGLDKKPEELAQVYGLVVALAEEMDVKLADLKKMEQERSKKFGVYKKGHFINTVTVPETSWLAEYYAKDPKRFPEIKFRKD